MSDDHYQEQAEKTVAAFRALLGEEAASRISDAEFTDLALMIRKVMAEEVNRAADRMAELVTELRREAGKPDIGL